MKIKRGKSVILTFVILTIFLAGFVCVSAQDPYGGPYGGGPGSSGISGVGEAIKSGIDSFVKAAKPLLNALVGETPGGELLFVKLLVLIILIGIVGYAVRRIPGIGENALLATVTQIIVALLATRFLTTKELVNFIWLPYGALGVILSALFPFIILFFFVESFDSTTFRKIMWVASIVIFIALASYRWADLKVGTDWWQNLGWIYMIIATLSALLLFFDKTVRKYYISAEIKRTLGGKSTLLEETLHTQLKDLNDAILRARSEGREENAKELTKQRDQILKALAKFQTEFGKKKK